MRWDEYGRIMSQSSQQEVRLDSSLSDLAAFSDEGQEVQHAQVAQRTLIIRTDVALGTRVWTQKDNDKNEHFAGRSETFVYGAHNTLSPPGRRSEQVLVFPTLLHCPLTWPAVDFRKDKT